MHDTAGYRPDGTSTVSRRRARTSTGIRPCEPRRWRALLDIGCANLSRANASGKRRDVAACGVRRASPPDRIV